MHQHFSGIATKCSHNRGGQHDEVLGHASRLQLLVWRACAPVPCSYIVACRLLEKWSLSMPLPQQTTLICMNCPPLVYPAARSPTSITTLCSSSAILALLTIFAVVNSTGAPQLACTIKRLERLQLVAPVHWKLTRRQLAAKLLLKPLLVLLTDMALNAAR